MANENLDQLKTKAQAAKSVLILLPPEPDQDLIQSGLALNQAFKQAGKQVIVGCSTPVPSMADIKTTVGKQNLIISFPYKEEAIEHVSYDIDETANKFNLIIRPKEGSQPLNREQVEYHYTGASADLVVTLGITSLEELGRIYSDEKNFLDNAQIINLKKGGQPADFASVDLSQIRVSSLAELTAWVLRSLDLKLSVESASALYRQLLTTTNNFQSPLITPETFEVAAYLLRLGAQRFQVPTAAMPPVLSATPANLPPAPFFPTPTPPSQLQHATPTNQPTKPKITELTQAVPGPKKPVPADWQGPKIFRGGQLR